MNPVALKFHQEHRARLERMGTPQTPPQVPVVHMVRPEPPPVIVKPAPKPPVMDYGRPSPVTSRAIAREIVAETAKEFQVYQDEIYSRQRNKRLVFARHVAVHRLRRRFPHWSFPQIGTVIGLDHTTVMYVLGKLKRQPAHLEAVRAAA